MKNPYNLPSNWKTRKTVEHIDGLLVSFFEVISRVISKERKMKHLSFFLSERLKKEDRVLLILALNSLQRRLLDKKGRKHPLMESTGDPSQILGELNGILHSFQGVEL